jgi:hypothetical protein
MSKIHSILRTFFLVAKGLNKSFQKIRKTKKPTVLCAAVHNYKFYTIFNSVLSKNSELQADHLLTSPVAKDNTMSLSLGGKKNIS